jgi:signal transduction histidine kinase
LGLSVTRSNIETHGGKLTCNSEPGVGTSFEVIIPIERRRRQEDEKACTSD